MKLRIALAAAPAALLAAGTASAQTQIDWWFAHAGRLGEIVQEMVANYNGGQDQCSVTATYKGTYPETLTAGIAAFRAGEQPEILQVFEVGTATMMAAEGAIYPVYQLMEDVGADFDPDAYLSAVTGYYTTTDGRMLSLPFNSSTPVLWINDDAFAAAGLDPANPPETWPEVFEAARAIAATDAYDCGLTTAWQSWIHLENLSARHDVPFATLDNGFGGLATEAVFNGPLQVRHIDALGELVQEGVFYYGGRTNEAMARFRAGECGMATESSAGYAGIKADAQFPFTVAPLPYWSDVEGAPVNTIIGGASLWVMAGHSDEEYTCVADFLNYLSQPDVQATWHQTTGYLPITSAAYDLTGEQGFYDENPGTDIAVQQMTAGTPTANSKGLRLGNFVQIRGVIDEELETVWAGESTAQEALDRAVERSNALLRAFERANP
ncbi:MAG: sn-glycerol-3-phosphate ABC transporter substrate-binding protein UgpB [Rhodospirillaceae bacterium]|nr:sn-glycerol-3-phosphate ABC transporter substrate-binding protein UgpB [Rhodospirillaceae bacterium]